jgi:predicted permease
LKSPGFAAVSVLTLALGIGANTAIFTIVNASLLRSLPYPAESSLLHLQETRPSEGIAQMEFSYPDFVDLRTRANSFESVAGYSSAPATYSDPNGVQVIPVAAVSANFFDTLGVRLAQGRSFLANADVAGGERAVVLTYQGWQRRFGGTPGILGQGVTLNGNLYNVVGILPQDFQFYPGRSTDFYLPLEVSGWTLRRNAHWIYPVARLRPGVTTAAAQAEISSIARQLEVQYSDSNQNVGMLAIPLRERFFGPVRPVLLALMGAVAAVLLIACLNLAAMQLARSIARRQEVAVRSALGASRRQILQLFMTENLVLTSIGGALGLGLAALLLRLVEANIPDDQLAMLPFLQHLHLDPTVFGFCLLVSALAGVFSGLAPAWQGSAKLTIAALHVDSRTTAGPDRHLLRSAMIVSQIAMAIVLLVGAGLLLKSLNRLMHLDPGFSTERLLTFQSVLPGKKYNAASVAQFELNLRTRLQSLPGVKSVATSSAIPLTGAGGTSRFVFEGHPRTAQYEIEANGRDVSPNYFATMGIPLRAGRLFDEHDIQEAPHVVIVNQTLARLLSPDGNVVGKRIDFTYTKEPLWVQVVGVVGDERVTSLDQQPAPVFYDPYVQSPSNELGIVIRTVADPIALADSVRRVVHELNPDVPVTGLATMDQIIQQSPPVLIRRYPAIMIGSFALLSLALATIGIYGLLAYFVAQRTRELGIRLALGAKRRDVLTLVVRNGLKLALVGIVIGVACSLIAARALGSLLFQVQPVDFSILVGVVTLLFAVVCLASFIPARRAATIEPMQALRSE